MSKRGEHKYTKNQILDLIQEFIDKNGRVPTTKDLDFTRDLPSRTTIKTMFDLPYSQFIKTYFNTYYNEHKSKYNKYTKQFLIDDFKKQFIEMGYPTKDEYNANRNSNSPQADLLCKIFHLKGYAQLLEFCGFDIETCKYMRQNKPYLVRKKLKCVAIRQDIGIDELKWYIQQIDRIINS